MKGVFGPVAGEVLAADLEVVEGAIPADLAGAFLRVGPNPKLPVEGGYVSCLVCAAAVFLLCCAERRPLREEAGRRLCRAARSAGLPRGQPPPPPRRRPLHSLLLVSCPAALV